VPQEEMENSQLALDQARLKQKLAQERLNLIMKGRAAVADQQIENVVRSPIEGMVLERKVNEGDPVVPLTSYQAGTEMMLLADMENLIFKGTVDEIDVGRLQEGMPARIKLGALPDARIEGTLNLIAPKALEQDNATMFDTEIRIRSACDVLLRAGYSANADIIIQEKTGVIVIPERLVTIRDDSVYVELKGDPIPIKQLVTLGISDGIQVEVLEGLQEGDSLVERPPKTVQ
jgi:HlyD family secretion protein